MIQIPGWPKGVKISPSGEVVFGKKKLRGGKHGGLFLQHKGVRYYGALHRLVAQVYLNQGTPIPRTQYVVQLDGNKGNPSLINLEIRPQSRPRPRPRRDEATHYFRRFLREHLPSEVSCATLREYIKAKAGFEITRSMYYQIKKELM